MSSKVFRKRLGDYFEVLGVGGLVDGSGDEVVEGPMLDLSFFLEGGWVGNCGFGGCVGNQRWIRIGGAMGASWP